MSDVQHFINGKPVAGSGDRFGDVFNPATGERLDGAHETESHGRV